MAFVHTHKDGSFWFTSQESISKIDRGDIDAMSPGFTSEEVSSKDARNRLVEHWSRQEPSVEEDVGDEDEKDVKKPIKKVKATPSDDAAVVATPTPEDERAQ
jgi:hypothetical protein